MGYNHAVMKKFASALFGTALAVFCTAPAARAWDKVGHMLVDQIAYDRLTPAAKNNVDSLLKTFNADPLVAGLDAQHQNYNAVTVGAFMDDIRGETKEFNTWHYVDLPDTELTPAQIKAQFGDDAHPNVYEAITNKCLKTLGDPKQPQADRARMFAFLCHLVGDIHQPMHAIDRDQGGNKYPIAELPLTDPTSTWHINNLHSFWDNAYRYDNVAGSITVIYDQPDLPRQMSPDVPILRSYSHGLVARYAPTSEQASDLDPAVWASESQKLALEAAYPKEKVDHLSPEYVHAAHDVACQRMVLAGERLANLLNATFK